jgi:hypothetical protein
VSDARPPVNADVSDIPSEVRWLVRRNGTAILSDAQRLEVELGELPLSSKDTTSTEVLLDAARFGVAPRLAELLSNGMEPTIATASVALALSQHTQTSLGNSLWGCSVLGFAAGMLPENAIPMSDSEATAAEETSRFQAGDDRDLRREATEVASGQNENRSSNSTYTQSSVAGRGISSWWPAGAAALSIIGAIVAFLFLRGGSATDMQMSDNEHVLSPGEVSEQFHHLGDDFLAVIGGDCSKAQFVAPVTNHVACLTTDDRIRSQLYTYISSQDLTEARLYRSTVASPWRRAEDESGQHIVASKLRADGVHRVTIFDLSESLAAKIATTDGTAFDDATLRELANGLSDAFPTPPR